MDKDQKIQEWLDGKTLQEPNADQDLERYKLLYKTLASPQAIDIPPFLAEKVLMRIESQTSASDIIKRWLKMGGLVLLSGIVAFALAMLGVSLIPQQTQSLIPYIAPLLFVVVLFLLIEMADQLLLKNRKSFS